MIAKWLSEISMSDHVISLNLDQGSGARRHEHTFSGGYRMR